MAPPGINTIFDHLDIQFPSVYFSAFAPLKSPFSLSSKLQPHHFALSSVQSDHDYSMKPTASCAEYKTAETGDRHPLPTDYSGGSGDAMLSSCAIDAEKVTEEGTDTDFLKDLDDLNFTFEDLDPCCDVKMEDSFQDFIDSALEQSYPSLLNETPAENNQQSCGQDAVILNKEQFLGTLNLVPAENNQNSEKIWLSSSVAPTPRASFSSSYSTTDLSSDVSCCSRIESIVKETCSVDMVPTRQCSCMRVDSVSSVVYSTAHPPSQECVRTCPSTLVTIAKDCTQNRVSSPLFIDVSPNEVSHSYQSSTEDNLDIAMDDDTVPMSDKESVDIMKWLSESQHNNTSANDNNNNVIICDSINDSSTVTEAPCQDTFTTPSLDLELYVDLEEFESETPDIENRSTQLDCSHRRTTDQCTSNRTYLKLPGHTERMGYGVKHCPGAYSDMISQSSQIETRSFSDLSYHVFSPAWSRTDSTHSLVSPLPLKSSDFSFSSDFEDTVDENLIKSPLELLNLFSDENASSLLDTDSTVPNIRFM